ncbi:MAG: hypothetical protein IKR09_05030 [Alphaproteobacteria bacterium]|nr:hypothetical protein [Alphaproteobacteria bacterium]
MTSFKNKLFAAALCLSTLSNAAAQEETYSVPSVHFLPLKKMEANAYGIHIPESTDVLNEDTWKNAVFPVTAAKFHQIGKQLPAGGEKLRLDLLKLTAAPPEGASGQAFIALKLKQLFDLAQFEDAYRLIQKIPEKTRGDSLNKIYADLSLTQNLNTACARKSMDGDDPFWQKLSAVCAAIDKKENEAFLALELLKEQKADNPFITKAVDTFLYGKSLKTPEKITPLAVAIWRAAGRKLTELKDPDDQIWFKAVFVSDETISVEQRLPFAEELTQSGLLSAEKLKTFYTRVSFEENQDTPLSPVLFRARSFQHAQAAADNPEKQNFIKKGLQSAKESGVLYAFSAAGENILKTLTPDPETLEESSLLIEAFVLAGLNEQAADWYKKAEILFPVSETTANGWYFAELAQTDKNEHFLIPALENMMAYAEKKKKADDAFTARIDRLMLMFQMLDMIPPDESWNYSSFAENSLEEELSERGKSTVPSQKSVGDAVLEALRELNGSYTGLMAALSGLTRIGLERDAALLAAQSADLILQSEKTHE